MTRCLMAVGVATLMTSSAQAQAYCDQVRLAVATYGYEQARRHALANYGKQAVEVAERCLRGRNLPRPHGYDGPGKQPRG